MHIAIDDTYGPTISTKSKYVTGNRRTNVGIAFPDEDVAFIREQVKNCIDLIKSEYSIEIKEFHFVEIYNRKSPWNKLPAQANLLVLDFFANIYAKYRWKVFVQTIDDRTLRDHGFRKIKGKIDQFDLSKHSDLSLFLLLIKIKMFYSNTSEDLSVFIDEGLGKPNTAVGQQIFYNYPNKYQGQFKSSHEEPLLQLADFIAFVINRSTHLYMKEKRTDIDNWFLELFNRMEINSDDFSKVCFAGDYSSLTISHFDEAHTNDRINKGLKFP